MNVHLDSRNGGDTSNEAHKRNSTDGNNKQTSEMDAFKIKNSVMYFSCLLKRLLFFYYHNVLFCCRKWENFQQLLSICCIVPIRLLANQSVEKPDIRSRLAVDHISCTSIVGAHSVTPFLLCIRVSYMAVAADFSHLTFSQAAAQLGRFTFTFCYSISACLHYYSYSFLFFYLNTYK